MLRQPLHDGWTVRVIGAGAPAAVGDRELPARVPGTVHTDLLRAGLIDDPYVGTNEAGLGWVGDVEWRYRTRFAADRVLLSAERIELVCEGLDTVATLELNGRRLGDAENMHREHRFDVRGSLRESDNELRVTFLPAARRARVEETRLGTLPWLNTAEPYNFVRKAAFGFGWDFAPALTGCGIFRPIALHGSASVRLRSVRPVIAWATAVEAVVVVHCDLAGDDAGSTLTAILLDPEGLEVARAERGSRPILRVREPRRWWPRGHGPQPLYTLRVELRRGGELCDAWTRRIGLRTVRLDDEADERGRRFAIVVNGKPIFCRGANWVPDDCFVDRAAEPARIRKRLGQAVTAGMNMVRVWGGGTYESEAFYDACDELGLMVWQDFAFACACYPEEEPHRSEVEAEARHNVARLASHPSLVLWNGCNENLWGYVDWGWKDKVRERTWGKGYYFELLPRIVKELDPSRPYWPGSPYSGEWNDDGKPHPNLPERGNVHAWDAWKDADPEAFRKIEPRFVSEFGWEGPATMATLARVLAPGDLSMTSAAMRARQRYPDGDARMLRLAERWFGRLPERFEELHYLLSLCQARAMKLAVEHYRSRAPLCMGTLYWQLNDCWPGTSWSAIDGDGRPKLLWFATNAFYADRLLVFETRPTGLVLHAVNDRDEPWEGRATIERRGFDGTLLASEERPLSAPPRAAAALGPVPPSLATAGDPSTELLVARAGDVRAIHFFDADRALRYPDPRLDSELASDGRTHRLTLTARTLVRDLVIGAERIDPQAVVSDGLLTLLPGDSAEIQIQSAASLTTDALLRSLQCANTFGAR